MPLALKPGQSSSKTDRDPIGLFGYQLPELDELRGGFWINLVELEYRLVDASGVEAQTWTLVDVDRDSPTTDAITSIRQGIYAPTITVPPGTSSFGEWRIEWRFRVEAGGPQLTSFTRFSVVGPTYPVVDGYAQVQDLYDEGVPTSMFSPARVAKAITLGSRLFDEWTGRHFVPRLLTLDVDGEGGPLKQLDSPIIGIASVEFTFTTFSPADLPIEEGDLRVYNRHIRNRMLEPDDREDPRIEFLRIENFRYPRETLLGDTDLLSTAIGFPLSQQNVKIQGVFGYTDPDGSAFGQTPELVKEAVLRIALRKIQPLFSASSGGGAINVAGPITSEKTLDQSVTYSDAAIRAGSHAFIGDFTGDPAVDQIVRTYRRPPILRSTSP